MSEPDAAPEPTEAHAAPEAGSAVLDPEGDAEATRSQAGAAEPGPESESEPQDSVAAPEPHDSVTVPRPRDGEPAESAVSPEPQDRAAEPEPQDSPPLSAEAAPAAAEPEFSQSTTQPQAGWASPDAVTQFAKFGGQYVAQPGQQPTMPFLAPEQAPVAEKKLPRKRIVQISVGSVTALALVGVGIVVLWPGRSGNSIVTAAHCQPSNLATCLLKPPAGAVQLSDSPKWDAVTTVTSDLYGSNIVVDAPGISSDTSSQLDSDGLHNAVHRDWNAVDGNNIDLVLLQFGSQKGAKSWNATRTGEIMATYRGRAVSIPGDSSGKAFAAAKPDAKGNVEAAYSVVVGDFVLNVAYSSPNNLDTKDLQNWAGTELASLKAAPPADADQPDAAPGTQQVACADRLASCLMPMPGDGEHWTSPNSNDWVSSASLTSAQFIKLFWDNKSQTQSDVQSNFATNGVTAIAHQDWTTGGGTEQADLYLIQTITAGGAEQLNSSNFGEPNWGKGLHGTSHSIPGEPNAQAWYTNQDSGGFVNFYFEENIGNVIVHGWLFFYGSFDSGTADRWAKSQLDLVSRSAKSEPMGLFPLTAPALPAASQGTCPASGDCLLPLPSGASDTTSSSYQVGKDLGGAAYASQYEPDVSTEVGTWLTADGYSTGSHRAFTTSDGGNADVVLLKYGSPAQAQAAAQLEYGLNAAPQHDRVCTDSKLPDSLCLATPVNVSDALQKETIRVLAWKGDYEVSVSVTKSNTADVADAFNWAQQQLDLLPSN